MTVYVRAWCRAMPRFTNSYIDRRQKLLLVLARRSRYVLFSKIALGLMITVLLGVVVILPLMEEEARITIAVNEKGQQAQPMMMNPKFQGTDAQNQPFTVTATRAFHKDADNVQLENIQADMTLKDRTWLALTADKGTINLGDQNLQLFGHVKIYHDKGYEFTTESMRIDTATGNVVGESALEGQGQVGNFKAEQFSIFDKGNRMILSGHVTMTIMPDA